MEFRSVKLSVMPAGTENGTPLPKDEPFAENAPAGAAIDYYLKSAAAGGVTIEILDARGESVRRDSSADRPEPVNPDALNIPAHWVHRPEPPPDSAGMHRWIWNLRPAPVAGGGRGGRGSGASGAGAGSGQGGGLPAAPGPYVVKLTVNGRTYTQPLTVKADPRVSR